MERGLIGGFLRVILLQMRREIEDVAACDLKAIVTEPLKKSQQRRKDCRDERKSRVDSQEVGS